MKKAMSGVVKTAVFGGLVLSLLVAAAASFPLLARWSFLNPDYLSVGEVCRRWGERPLDVAAFRSAEKDESTRAAMACSLLKTQDDYVGMDSSEIGALFGNPYGYYYYDSHPAYMIESAKTRGQDAWQIVFLVGRDGKVSEVFVHKNCC
ncbi:MAG: hypothetical protein OXH59_09520 [Rhodospirillaceae bacterium]|nr:hypothetical protein [Rhodospirillaceae bacterium]